uniref:phytoene/squalene synthase family protein n=1 Tax=Aciditerrimonas ferrireducens TaxID=667306 RepID=UPI003671DAEF
MSLTAQVPASRAEWAFARCEAITRREAKNFAFGIRLLPPEKRRALSAVYALARRVDDIGDGDAPPAERRQALGSLREQVRELVEGRLPAGAEDDPVLVAVAAAAERFPLPLAAFGELIEGCEQDVVGARYETLADLVGYCRKVAGTIGRLSLGVFGCPSWVEAEPLADDLGVALQLTNVLRDVREDQAMGRCYLPQVELRACGLDERLAGPPEALASVVGRLAAEAEGWYRRGLPLLSLLDRRSRACTATMAGIYHRLLQRIGADPLAVTRGRVSLSTGEKVAVALWSLAGGGA